MEPTLSAVIPATNDPESLSRCLAAIADASSAPEEVIVVERPAHAPPAEARNRGAQKATGNVLVFIDADVEVHPDAFLRIRKAFDRDDALTAVFGAYDDAPAATDRVSAFRNLLHHYVHSASAGPASSFWAGIGAVRREAFVASGGFDARRYRAPSIEDIELGARLAASGARIDLDPRIRGKHLKRWTLAEMVRTDLVRRGAPWIELLLQQRALDRALNLGWRHRLSAGACLAAVGAAIARKGRWLAVSCAALVLLNRSFYGLLARCMGPIGLVAGVGLHVVHHLTAVASVPAGLFMYMRGRRRPGGDRVPTATLR